MMWEVWLESAETFEALKKSLHNRGYRQLPSYARNMVYGVKEDVATTKGQNIKKSMLRKKRR